MERDSKKVIVREGLILSGVSVLALLLTLVSVWPALYNHCWEIVFTILLPVYGLYFCVQVLRLVSWAIRRLKKPLPKV